MAKKKTKYWRRTIDSAQRRVEIDNPDPTKPGLERLELEIQGLRTINAGDNENFTEYNEMAEQGVKTEGQKPLTVFKRLLRVEARVGVVSFDNPQTLRVRFWTRPHTDLIIDVTEEEGRALWREVEILVRSAGFNFILPEGVKSD